jgi:hypothetical protein
VLLELAGEPLEVELALPVGQVRLVVVGPTLVAAFWRMGTVRPKDLVQVDTHRVRELAIVEVLVRLTLPYVPDGLVGVLW